MSTAGRSVGGLQPVSPIAAPPAWPRVEGDPVMLHNIQRPQWTCTVDGRDWPCSVAKRLLGDSHPDVEQLSRHMLRLQAQAETELELGPPALYRRFVAWTLPEDAVCRVCGTSGHDVLAGIPPHLIPCNGYVIEPLIRPSEG
jgi:hypothetical protein